MTYNQEYIQSLIDNKREESLSLEYKAAGSLVNQDRAKNNISIVISSFANSGGGTIFYGIQEDDRNKHLPIRIDPIDRNQISKEWLEQIIDSRIHPKIGGIEIYPIEINGDSSRVVYIIDVPQSNTAHQAGDKRYHKRRNFKSDIMEDYEIRDVMNRSKTPIIELEFDIERITTHEPINPTEVGAFARTHPVYHYYLIINAINRGKILAYYINAFLTIPRRCILDLHVNFLDKELVKYSAENKVREITGADSFNPLLPGLESSLRSAISELHHSFCELGNNITWEVYADNAEPRAGKVAFSEIRVTSKEFED